MHLQWQARERRADSASQSAACVILIEYSNFDEWLSLPSYLVRITAGDLERQ